MPIVEIINQIEYNREVFKNLLMFKTEKEFLWRPKPEKWNILEIVCHLVDEERDDFKTRVKHALETPTKELVPIDPEGWVEQRGYASMAYDKTLRDFLEERKASVEWLRNLVDVSWNNIVIHPELGELSAEQLLANWLAHDYLHIRQILRYQYQYLNAYSNFDLSYAGDW